jgi:hypothetical protein
MSTYMAKMKCPSLSGQTTSSHNATSNFTAIVTGHGNIKTYLYKYKIIESPKWTFEDCDHSVDHNTIWLQTSRAWQREIRGSGDMARKMASE